MAAPNDPEASMGADDSAAPSGGDNSNAAPPSGADNAAEESKESGPQEVVEQFMAIRQAMAQMLQGLGGQGNFPPEGTKALTAALQAYTQFLTVFGKYTGVDVSKMQSGSDDQSTLGQQSPEMQGSRNAVPADQAVGRNVNPVPAR